MSNASFCCCYKQADVMKCVDTIVDKCTDPGCEYHGFSITTTIPLPVWIRFGCFFFFPNTTVKEARDSSLLEDSERFSKPPVRVQYCCTSTIKRG